MAKQSKTSYLKKSQFIMIVCGEFVASAIISLSIDQSKSHIQPLKQKTISNEKSSDRLYVYGLYVTSFILGATTFHLTVATGTKGRTP